MTDENLIYRQKFAVIVYGTEPVSPEMIRSGIEATGSFIDRVVTVESHGMMALDIDSALRDLRNNRGTAAQEDELIELAGAPDPETAPDDEKDEDVSPEDLEDCVYHDTWEGDRFTYLSWSQPFKEGYGPGGYIIGSDEDWSGKENRVRSWPRRLTPEECQRWQLKLIDWPDTLEDEGFRGIYSKVSNITDSRSALLMVLRFCHQNNKDGSLDLALRMITAMLSQKGCLCFGQRADRLTDLIDIIIHG